MIAVEISAGEVCRFDQRADAGEFALLKSAEAKMGENAVLADEWNDIGDGPQCGQGCGFDEEVPERFADAGCASDGLPDSPRQLKRDAGAAEIRIGIRQAGSRQPGMNDGMTIGKPRRIAVPLMVVAYDQIDIAFAGRLPPAQAQ